MTVVVVGSANMDLFAYMPRLPLKGETLHGHRSSTCCGGKGSNQAIQAARMSVPCTMISKVGADQFGEALKAAYEADGIDTSHVYQTSDVSTGTAQIWVDDEGSNSIVIIAGANALLTPEDVLKAEEVVAAASVVVCQLEVPPETTLEALRLARKHKVLSIFNPAPAKPDLDQEFLMLADIIAPNETELSLLTGGLPVETVDQIKIAARALLKKADGAKILVTLGSKGALLVTQGVERVFPCPEVKKVVDTSGAGDCFIGSLAAYLAKGMDLKEAIPKAGAIASISVTRTGTQPSYPRMDEVPIELRM